MSTQPVPNPPPGFDQLSKEEQIEYLQELWNQVSSQESEVPVPDWHREILRERLANTNDQVTESWTTVKARLAGRSRG